MPLFYFNTADGGRDSDLHGTDLSDLHAARVEGIRFAGEALANEPALLRDGEGFRVEVLDRERTLLFTIIALAVNAPAGGATE